MNTTMLLDEQDVPGLIRYDAPRSYLSAGRLYTPQRYVIGWADPGIVKVGITDAGRSRWGKFLATGGTMIDLGYYNWPATAEAYMQTVLSGGYAYAFTTAEEAVPYLGPGGGGFTECFRVPASDWDVVREIAGEL